MTILYKRSLPSTHLVHDNCILKCKAIFLSSKYPGYRTRLYI